MARADLDDLLPLFLEEAGSRLDRLADLLPAAREDPAAGVQVRRELHALKGASRMMGLTEVADLCHQAEDLMVGEAGDGTDDASRIVERVVEIVDGLQTGVAAASDEAFDTPERRAGGPPVIRGGSGELRVATTVVDALAEAGTRMRIAARSTTGPVQRLFELASAAERGFAEGSLDTLADLGSSLRRVALELERNSKSLQQLSDEQLDAMLRLQLQPLRPFLRTLVRHTRELAASLGKEVEVTSSGGKVLLDRRILEAIREAALHLAHNAVDHGIEEGEDRIAAGKPRRGRIRFGAATDGDRVQLTVRDDGRGIDPDAVIRVAVERGMINPAAAAQIQPGEAYQLLELPGFTTRDLATDVSGRGVGLDAVAASFRSIGGDLWIRSNPGRGTRVTVELPVTRRGERVLVVEVGRLVLGLPSAAVKSFRRLSGEMLVTEKGRTVVRLGDADLPAVAVAPLFDEAVGTATTMVETTIGGRSTAVIVDAIIGEEEVIVRPLAPVAGAPPVVEGIALLTSGLPVAVLSLRRLGSLELEEMSDPTAAGEQRVLRVLLTDDSPATREMTRRLLEDEGYEVVAVENAEEALDRIEREPYDCVVTGVDLPGLSGIDLTRKVRSSDLFSDLPIVMISTRDRPADRFEGLEAGADAYLTKQDMDPERLVELVRRLGAG